MMTRVVGRPTKYKEEYNDQAYKLCKQGATRKALAVHFKVPDATIYSWIIREASFKKAIDMGCTEFVKSGINTHGEALSLINSDEYVLRVLKKRPSRVRHGRKKYLTTNGKIEACLRARLYHAVKGNVKNRSIKGLSFSIDELKNHLEPMFLEGMSWENYGEWHIDHIRPCILFDHSNDGEFKECWSLENLQPLWARDNIIKGAKYECAQG